MTRSVSRNFEGSLLDASAGSHLRRLVRLAAVALATLLMTVRPVAAQTGYVANLAGGGFVSFIDGRTDTIVSGPVNTVIVGGQATYLALSPDNTRLYVSVDFCNYPDASQGCVAVIRADALATSPTVKIPVGEFPGGLALTPDGSRLYVVNGGDNTISVIDTSTDVVVQTITGTPSGKGEIVMSPDGTRAYVPGFANGRQGVTVIDTTTNTVAGQLVGLSSGEPIYGIAITPDGGRLYVANGNLVDINGNYVGSNTVAAIDIATNTRLATISVAPQPWDIAITPDGSKAYVAGFDPHGASGTLTVIDTATNGVITAIPTDCCLSVPTMNPDGSKVYVSNTRFGAYGIEVFSTATDTQVATIGNSRLFPTQFAYPQGIAFTHPSAKTPAQMVSDLIASLSDPALKLKTGQVNSLTDKLNSALLSIQQGLNAQAINQLNAFVKAVTDLKNGKISSSSAAVLVNAANAVMATLSTP
jgi:YVTN family beta-propeller protein